MIVKNQNNEEKKLVFKLDEAQAYQLIWMTMLGIQTSEQYINYINNYIDDESYYDAYYEDIAYIQFRIQGVKPLIDELIKLADLKSEDVILEKDFLISSLKGYGISVLTKYDEKDRIW